MHALSDDEELEHAARVLDLRRKEFNAAQSYLIQAENRYHEAAKKVAKNLSHLISADK